MTSAIMPMFSGLPDQKMLEVRNLFTEARIRNSVINTDKYTDEMSTVDLSV